MAVFLGSLTKCHIARIWQQELSEECVARMFGHMWAYCQVLEWLLFYLAKFSVMKLYYTINWAYSSIASGTVGEDKRLNTFVSFFPGAEVVCMGTII